MAFSPLYHLHHQSQHHQVDSNNHSTNPYFNHTNSTMAFSVTDILHHQAVLNNNLCNYSNGPSSSSSTSSSLSLSTNQLDDSFNANYNKKHGLHHANSAIITPPSYSNTQSSLNDQRAPVTNNSSSSINIIPPCTPSPSIHSPVNTISNNLPSCYNPSTYSSFSSTPNGFNHADQTTAALAYLNSYGILFNFIYESS